MTEYQGITIQKKFENVQIPGNRVDRIPLSTVLLINLLKLIFLQNHSKTRHFE